jgi:hypothetical protein
LLFLLALSAFACNCTGVSNVHLLARGLHLMFEGEPECEQAIRMRVLLQRGHEQIVKAIQGMINARLDMRVARVECYDRVSSVPRATLCLLIKVECSVISYVSAAHQTLPLGLPPKTTYVSSKAGDISKPFPTLAIPVVSSARHSEHNPNALHTARHHHIIIPSNLNVLHGIHA